MTFVVAGGESQIRQIAGMNDFVHQALKFYPHIPREKVRMILVHPGEVILPELSEKLGRYAQRKLEARGVEIRSNSGPSRSSGDPHVADRPHARPALPRVRLVRADVRRGPARSHNIREYEVAARFARECGREDLIDRLLMMAEVEWDHEAYFRARVLSHPWSRRIAVWPQPPPRESIRAAFAD